MIRQIVDRLLNRRDRPMRATDTTPTTTPDHVKQEVIERREAARRRLIQLEAAILDRNR